MTPFDGKCKSLRTSFLTCFFFATVLSVLTILTVKHTDGQHRNGQAHSYMRNLTYFPSFALAALKPSKFGIYWQFSLHRSIRDFGSFIVEWYTDCLNIAHVLLAERATLLGYVLAKFKIYF